MSAPPIVQANKKNLLQLIQAACDEMGVKQPSQIFGATDNQTRQLLALANREGKEFYNQDQRKGGWQELRQQFLITLQGFTTDLAGNSVTGNLTKGSNQITNVSYLGNVAAPSSAGSWQVLGSNIPYDANVMGISGTTITMDNEATATVIGQALTFGQTAYPFSNDFGYYQTQTSWDRSFRWQLLGPLEAQEWQVLKSGISPTGPRRRFRIFGGFWNVDPPPTQTELIVFEYFSNAWCQSSGGVAQNIWAADTDYYTLDDDAFILGMQWRWKSKKGLDYTQEKDDYERLKERLMSRNGANRDLPLNSQASGLNLLNQENIPDTGFGT